MNAKDLVKLSSQVYWDKLPAKLRHQMCDCAVRGQWWITLTSKPEDAVASTLKLLGFSVEHLGSSFGGEEWRVSWLPKEF